MFPFLAPSPLVLEMELIFKAGVFLNQSGGEANAVNLNLNGLQFGAAPEASPRHIEGPDFPSAPVFALSNLY